MFFLALALLMFASYFGGIVKLDVDTMLVTLWKLILFLLAY